MREIKFRGYSKRLKTWLYGNLVTISKKAYIFPISSKKDVIRVEKFNNYLLVQAREAERLVDINSVGQYTGLKDKNGKEIYESDIVRCEKGGEWEIVFDNGCFKALGVCGKSDGLVVPQIQYKTFEVIGNVFENKKDASKLGDI